MRTSRRPSGPQHGPIDEGTRSAAGMKVRIDFELCSGHGRCYAICPEVFSDDEKGYPVLASELVPSEAEAGARAAANNCPERAIGLSEEASVSD